MYPKFMLCFQRHTQSETPQMLKQGAVLTPEEMSELRSDLEHMYTPSWLTSVPTNLGEPSHGKLKADQWRTLGTTYLPVSLIRLWDQLEDNDQRSHQCKKLLALTLSLISAVIVASSRTTSQEKADLSTSITCKHTSMDYASFFLNIDFYQINTWRFILPNICSFTALYILGGPFLLSV
jgi:hypothetical protein